MRAVSLAMVGASLAGALAFGAGVHAQEIAKDAMAKQLVLQGEGSFYVGGREVRSDTISYASTFGNAGTITVDQIYVHYQTPVNAETAPKLVLIHMAAA